MVVKRRPARFKRQPIVERRGLRSAEAREESVVRVVPSPPLSRNCDRCAVGRPLSQNTPPSFTPTSRRGPRPSMKRFFLPTLLAAMAAPSLVGLGAFPSQAHGLAAGGALGGLAHPLLGVDHLLMLLAVGTAASLLSSQLLFWALGGGLIGAICGIQQWSVPLAEVLAAMAIVAVASMAILGRGKLGADRSFQLLSGVVVGTGVAIHGLLHGLEAPSQGADLLWWSGTLISSVALCGGTTLSLRRLPRQCGRAVALAVLLSGGGMVLAS
jgi:urease accessory protein